MLDLKAPKTQMKQITQEQCLKVLICSFVCFTMLYWNMFIEQKHLVVVSNYNTAAAATENMEKKVNVTHLMYWKNDSLYDDITCKSDMKITSCKYSKIHLLKADKSAGIIEIAIQIYDGYNRKKTNGGDVILMQAKKLPSGGSAPGHVIDHMNGSFYGRVQIHWSGRTKVSVKLVSAKENQCLRFRAMENYGNSVFALKTPYCIHYRFVNQSVHEFTRCAPYSFVYGYKKLCNFTNLNYGFSWFCGKPTKEGLDCNSYNKFQVKRLNLWKIVPHQSKDELIHNPGHCEVRQKLIIFMNKRHKSTPKIPKTVVKCSQRLKQDSWTESTPTGYSIRKNWKFNNCLNNFKFTNKNLRKCLKSKRISFIGDSTLRQYFEVLALAMHISIQSAAFNKSARTEKNSIHLTWRKHEMPFYNRELFEQEKVRSTTFQIDELANDDSLAGNSSIVVVHYGSHLQAFPPSVYRSRIRQLAHSLKRLLKKKPETTILVKGAAPVIQDTHWFDVRISLIFNEILFQEFADLQRQVTYLDVFSIFVANNHQQLHPFGQTLTNQVQQLLAYIC